MNRNSQREAGLIAGVRTSLIAALCALGSVASATVLDVPVPQTRSANPIGSTDAAVRAFAKNASILTARSRSHRPNAPFALPMTVFPTVNGKRASITTATRGGNDLSLVFDTASGRTFSASYQTFLTNLWTTMKPRMDALFGPPAVGGSVLVSNLGADLSDREYITGGYYVYNGTTDQQIRFEEYTVPEAAAVHFIHTLLLAYIGPKVLPTDGYQEGVVRAAVLKLCRTPGALPVSLDMTQVERVLANAYDIGPGYHWANQKSLAAPTFIAANLRNTTLPSSGSVGGPYLQRYLMAGSAFQKVLVEYPTFPSTFLQNWYNDTTRNPVTVAQQTLDTIKGVNSTVEGLTFDKWSARQGVLGQKIIAGTKLNLEVTPITSGLSGADFGVFNIEAEWYKSLPNGDETLLSDTAYPIYWSPDFNRVFASAQDDRVDISLAYGSVTPNFVDALSGQKYRLAVDFPVGDEVVRSYLPVGAIATAANPTENTVYGTISGVTYPTGISYRVSLSWAGGGTAIVPVQNYAFGGLVTNANFADAQSVTVQLLRDVSGGGSSVVATQIVNKGPGALAFDLHVGADQQGSLTIPAGLAMTGFQGTPVEAYAPSLLGTAANNTLLARWDPLLGGYKKFPSTGALTEGQGFFSRLDSLKTVNYDFLREEDVPHSVRLKPGWNIVSSPMGSTVLQGDVKVITTTGFPQAFADAAAGGVVGPDIFRLQASTADPFSGVPESGSMVKALSFDPGVATYVRVLSSDGAVLVFPAHASGRAMTREASTLLNLAVTGAGSTSSAQAGTDANPKNLASGLPPLLGGLQVSVNGPAKLFREVKSNVAGQTFLFTAENLVKGQTYTVNLSAKNGFKKYLFWDVNTGKKLIPSQAEKYTFKATSTTRQFRVAVYP